MTKGSAPRPTARYSTWSAGPDRVARAAMATLLLVFVILNSGFRAAHADSLPGLIVNDVTKVRPTTGTSTFTFTIGLTHADKNPVTVSYATADGSARSTFDYVPTAGSVTFAPGKTTQTVNVTVNGTTLHTGDRNFYLNLSSPQGATLVHGEGSGWIIDGTELPYLNVADTSATEGSGSPSTAIFNVALTAPSANTVKVHYSTSNGSAAAGADYSATNGTLTFAPGATSEQVDVPVTAVGVFQGAKGFYLNLSKPVNAAIGDGSAQGTILNTNHVAYLTEDDTAVQEPNSGTATANVPVRVASVSNFPVTVAYATGNGSATAGTDYVAANGTVTIPAGKSSVNVPVTIDASGLTATKYFYLNLNSPSSGASLLRSSATVTIGPAGYNQITVGDTGVIAPGSGTATEVFTVSLAAASPSTVSVNYATADSSAQAGTEYKATSGTLTFAPGTVSQTVSVTVLADPSQFNDVYYYLQLSGAVGVGIERTSALGQIEAAYVEPYLSVSSSAVIRPASGTTTQTFTVSLSGTSPNTVTVIYNTQNGSAVSGTDYQPTNGLLTFAPGTTSQTVNVTINGSTLAGSDLYYTLGLGSATNAQIAGSYGLGYIQNPNRNPSLSVNSVAVYKPQSGTTTAKVTVTLSGASPNTVSVAYNTQNGSATSGVDYTASSGTLTFAPGATTQTFPVNILGNTNPTGDRYLYAEISGASNASIVSSSGYVTIIDSSVEPYLSVASTTVQKPSSGSGNAVFTVTLSPASATTVTVNYATSDGSAKAGTDYTATTGTLTFPPGTSAKTVKVPVAASTVHTGDLYFYLSLSSATNAGIGGQSYNTGTIIDPNVSPALSVMDSGVLRPSTGSTTENFTVTLQPASLNTVTVNYATINGSATAGIDYTSASGTLSFSPGATSQTVSVPVLGNSASVPDRYFYLSLSSPVNAQILRSSGYGEIVDTVAPTSGLSYFTVSDSTVAKPSSGTATESFTVGLFPAASTPVNVNYYTSDGSAISSAGDYSSARGTLSFAAGVTSQTVSVTVNGNTVPGPDHYFTLSLSANTGPTTFQRGSSYGYILDGQPDSRVYVGPDQTVNRGDSGSATVNFSVQLSSPQQFPVQVDYTTTDGSAVAPDGYTPDSGTVTFAAGQTGQVIPIGVPGNSLFTGVQSFYLDLSNPVSSTTAATRETGIIYNLDTFAITGKVIGPSGAGTAGVTVTRTGNNQPSAAVTTAADGTFSIPNTIDGKYTVTPTLTGTSFLPGNASVTVLGANIAVPTFLGYSGTGITGLAANSAGKAISGVTVTLSGGGAPTTTTTTDTSGYYAFGNVAAGTGYSVSPAATGYAFNPTSYTENVATTTIKNQDFVGVQGIYIVGRVTTSSAAGDAGVTITRSGGGGPAAIATTNSQGYYGFSSNPATTTGVTYTITPSKTGATFTPASASATVTTTSDATGVNFTQN